MEDLDYFYFINNFGIMPDQVDRLTEIQVQRFVVWNERIKWMKNRSSGDKTIEEILE